MVPYFHWFIFMIFAAISLLLSFLSSLFNWLLFTLIFSFFAIIFADSFTLSIRFLSILRHVDYIFRCFHFHYYWCHFIILRFHILSSSFIIYAASHYRYWLSSPITPYLRFIALFIQLYFSLFTLRAFIYAFFSFSFSLAATIFAHFHFHFWLFIIAAAFFFSLRWCRYAAADYAIFRLLLRYFRCDDDVSLFAILIIFAAAWYFDALFDAAFWRLRLFSLSCLLLRFFRFFSFRWCHYCLFIWYHYLLIRHYALFDAYFHADCYYFRYFRFDDFTPYYFSIIFAAFAIFAAFVSIYYALMLPRFRRFRYCRWYFRRWCSLMPDAFFAAFTLIIFFHYALHLPLRRFFFIFADDAFRYAFSSFSISISSIMIYFSPLLMPPFIIYFDFSLFRLHYFHYLFSFHFSITLLPCLIISSMAFRLHWRFDADVIFLHFIFADYYAFFHADLFSLMLISIHVFIIIRRFSLIDIHYAPPLMPDYFLYAFAWCHISWYWYWRHYFTLITLMQYFRWCQRSTIFHAAVSLRYADPWLLLRFSLFFADYFAFFLWSMSLWYYRFRYRWWSWCLCW